MIPVRPVRVHAGLRRAVGQRRAAWRQNRCRMPSVAMLFLMTVVVIALRFGRLAGTWAGFVCAGCFDFLFVEPRLSFAVSDPRYVFTFMRMLAVALATGQFSATCADTIAAAARGARRAHAGHAAGADHPRRSPPDRHAVLVDRDGARALMNLTDNAAKHVRVYMTNRRQKLEPVPAGLRRLLTELQFGYRLVGLETIVPPRQV
ncbi:DUF4118 domain-containing protein [Burkholderia anthina]|uniref:DUF4118 domain-containing protein n=2 Tax=Burkholderiaceae TaxID=119060 RepID=UPI0021BBEFBE|nr:DUF4118 domain-containing protein [Burkholderia anthina]